MANANEPSAQTSPPQPGGRHQIKRSLTELAVPVKLKSGHHSKHPVQQQVRKDRYQDGREPQTAHPGAIRHSLDLPRPDVLNASRRTSAMASRDDDVSRANSKQPSSKGSKDGKLRKELDKTDGRIEGLKESLVELHTFSTMTTTRLDETYYAVLEKTSAMQNTIAALKDLAETSRNIYAGFEKESRDLEAEIATQLSDLSRFDGQQSTIEALQQRIQSGRTKVQSLSGRVDVVRDRVEAWERADQEWQNRTRRRLKVIWSVMFVATVAVIMLSVVASFWGSEGPTADSLDSSSSISNDGVSTDDPRTRTLHCSSLNISRSVPVLGEDGDVGSGETLLWKRPREADERLHEFDEL